MNISGLASLLGVAGDLLGGAGAGAGGASATSPLGGLASLAESLLGGDSTQVASSDPFSAIEALTNGVDKLATSGLSSLLGSAGGLGSIAGLLA